MRLSQPSHFPRKPTPSQWNGSRTKFTCITEMGVTRLLDTTTGTIGQFDGASADAKIRRY